MGMLHGRRSPTSFSQCMKIEIHSFRYDIKVFFFVVFECVAFRICGGIKKLNNNINVNVNLCVFQGAERAAGWHLSNAATENGDLWSCDRRRHRRTAQTVLPLDTVQYNLGFFPLCIIIKERISDLFLTFLLIFKQPDLFLNSVYRYMSNINMLYKKTAEICKSLNMKQIL